MKSSSLLFRILCLAALLPVLIGQHQAQNFVAVPTQVTPTNDTGLRSQQTYSGVHENINLSNGNLNIDIPLVSLPGRNGLNLSLSLQYDSKIWSPHQSFSNVGADITYTWRAERRDPQIGDVGWRLSWPTLTAGSYISDNAGTRIGAGDSIVTLADGGKHSLGSYHIATNGDLTPLPGDRVMDAEDGSFLQVDRTDLSDIIVRTKDGTAIHFAGPESNANKIEDTNGNYVTMQGSDNVTTFADTLGRTITFDSTDPLAIVVKSKDSYGNDLRTVLHLSWVSLLQESYPSNNAFAYPIPQNNQCANCKYFVWASAPHNISTKMLTSIDLPNNTRYTFAYNDYGELTQITYPTGGYSKYDYSERGQDVHKEYFWERAALTTQADFREVRRKRVCANTSGTCTPQEEKVTTYNPTIIDTSNGTMEVIDPTGDRTVYEFYNYVPDGGLAKYYSSREHIRTTYDANHGAIKVVLTEYNRLNSIDSCSGGGIEFSSCSTGAYYLPTSITTTLKDGASSVSSRVELEYDSYTAHAQWPPALDGDPGYEWTFSSSYLTAIPRYIDNVVHKREYDYAANQSDTLLRQTNTTWANASSSLWAAHIWNRPLSEEITDGSARLALTQYEYDNYTQPSPMSSGLASSGAIQHDSITGARGNLTKLSRWRDTPAATIETRHQYDDAGNLIETLDPLLRLMRFDYSDSFVDTRCIPVSPTKAYATRVTDPLGHQSSKKYNSCTGTVSEETDVNGLKVRYKDYDAMDRVREVDRPDGGITTISYIDGPGSTLTTSESIDTPSHKRISISRLDGLGHVVQKELQKALPGGLSSYQDTTYDGVGRVYSVSNWHGTSPSPTDGVTSYTYDALDRVTFLTQPDSSHINTNYSLNLATVTDEAGKRRKSQTDALGRLTKVWEDPAPENPAGLNYETDYVYNPRGDLICAVQKGSDTTAFNGVCSSAPATWRPRSFTYNSLSQLLTATNPESGTITYGYDANGNMTSRQDARGITTTLGYDEEHRLRTKSYSNGDPSVSYFYDESACDLNSCVNLHQRTHMIDAVGSGYWSYGITANVGRKVAERRTITTASPPVTKTTTTQFDLSGGTASVSYPSGNVVTYTSDDAGRPIRAKDATANVTFADDVTYTPTSGLATLKSGANLNSTFFYNNRLQPCRISVRNSGSAPSECTSATLGNVLDLTYNFNPGTNNGNVVTITNNRETSRSRSFAYDTLNRLTSATAGPWANTYDYDGAWGNLVHKNQVSGKEGELFQQGANNLNRIDGWCYDAAGNLLHQGACGPIDQLYDAESRIVSAGGVTYGYDGDGQRLSKSNGTLYFGSGPLVETNLTGTVTYEFVFFSGKRIARRDGTSGRVHYFFSDHLGSASIVTDAVGTMSNCTGPDSVVRSSGEDESDYYPWGGERVLCDRLADQNYKFTGKERDTETGFDSFGARYYASAHGRWMTPDWADKPTEVPYAEFGNPQSLNLFSFVHNNPTTLLDVNGHFGDPCGPQGEFCTTEEAQKAQEAADNQKQKQPKPGNKNHGNSSPAKVLDWLNENYVGMSSQCSGGTISDCFSATLTLSMMVLADAETGGGANTGRAGRGQIHHIATDKAIVSGLTERFEALFAKAGRDLQWRENLMRLPGHLGRHAEAYHEHVFDRLTAAVGDLVGKDAEKALRQALRELRREIRAKPLIVKGTGM